MAKKRSTKAQPKSRVPVVLKGQRKFPKAKGNVVAVKPVDVSYAFHGSDLRDAIERAGYTLKTFAEATGVHISRVSHYCRDTIRFVTTDKLEQFADALARPQSGGKAVKFNGTVRTDMRAELLPLR